ncbi:hypothetical protein Nmel_006563 [Mimus melanotis]
MSTQQETRQYHLTKNCRGKGGDVQKRLHEFLISPPQTSHREQSRTPNLVHPHGVCHLESTVCQLCSQLGVVKRICENKVEDLGKQLHLAHSETAEGQTDQAQHGQKSGNPNDQIHQLLNTESSIPMEQLRRQLDNSNLQLQSLEKALKEMRVECHSQMECRLAATEEKKESIGRISSLIVQLEMTKEVLLKSWRIWQANRGIWRLLSKQAQLWWPVCRTRRQSLARSSGSYSQLGSRMQERGRRGEGCLQVQWECGALKLRLLEKERITEIFQKEIGSMAKLLEQWTWRNPS